MLPRRRLPEPIRQLARPKRPNRPAAPRPAIPPAPPSPFSPSSRRAVSSSSRRASPSSSSARRPPPAPPFPTVPTCPAPTCACSATPPMPEGLEIDRVGALNGVVAGYAEQVLVCTGRDDWPSRIEEEDGGDNLAADLKELFGRGGRFSDPFHNVAVLNSSFPSSPAPASGSVALSGPGGPTLHVPPGLQTASAYLLPSFLYVPFLPRVSFEAVEALARGYLLPRELHSAHGGLSPVHRDRLTRKEAYRSLLWGVREVGEVVVLICGHGGRDMRCGVMGPALRGEFERLLPAMGLTVLEGPVDVGGAAEEPAALEGGGREGTEAAAEAEGGAARPSVRVGLISHVGGHKFAGNVIIYLPPGMRSTSGGGDKHALAGMGIWYGRVEPKHVEGIVRETILGGRVIADLFRGGIDQDRRILRL